MICKECNKTISEGHESRYVQIRLYEKIEPKVLNNIVSSYAVDKGNIFVCYECWKEVSPSQYHIQENTKGYNVPFTISGIGTKTNPVTILKNSEESWTIDMKYSWDAEEIKIKVNNKKEEENENK